MPERVQLSRQRGWRMPPNTVKVDRSTRWGNPFKVGDAVQSSTAMPVAICFSQREAVEAFRGFCGHNIGRKFVDSVKQELRGKNLACWCKPGEPCHADVLLELANAEVAE